MRLKFEEYSGAIGQFYSFSKVLINSDSLHFLLKLIIYFVYLSIINTKILKFQLSVFVKNYKNNRYI